MICIVDLRRLFRMRSSIARSHCDRPSNEPGRKCMTPRRGPNAQLPDKQIAIEAATAAVDDCSTAAGRYHEYRYRKMGDPLSRRPAQLPAYALFGGKRRPTTLPGVRRLRRCVEDRCQNPDQTAVGRSGINANGRLLANRKALCAHASRRGGGYSITRKL